MDQFLLRRLLTNSSFALTRDLKNSFDGPFPTINVFSNEIRSRITVWKSDLGKGREEWTQITLFVHIHPKHSPQLHIKLRQRMLRSHIRGKLKVPSAHLIKMS